MKRGLRILSVAICSVSRNPNVYGYYSSSSSSLRSQKKKFGSPLPLYVSDDETEERILEALEKLDQDQLQTQTSEDYTPTSYDGEDEEVDKDVVSERSTKQLDSTAKDNVDQQHSPSQLPSPSNVQLVSIPSGFQVNVSASPKTEMKKTETTAEAAPPPSSSTTSSWVRRFLAQCHRDVLLPVPTDFLLDNFNLAHLAPVVEAIGMQAQHHSIDDVVTSIEVLGSTSSGSSSSNPKQTFPIYRQALRLLLDQAGYDSSSGIPDYLDRAARALYLLVHQRYVLSPRGLDMVRRRFLLKAPSIAVDPIFGKCPRLSCRGMPLLPFGDSEDYNIHNNYHDEDEDDYYASRAKRYCCSCRHVWYHWDSRVEGCAWGPSFCHLFLMTCGHEVFGAYFPSTEQQGTSSMLLPRHHPKETTHVPRIFGFKLHPLSSTSWYQ